MPIMILFDSANLLIAKIIISIVRPETLLAWHRLMIGP